MLVIKESYRNEYSLVELWRVENSRESHSGVVQTRESLLNIVLTTEVSGDLNLDDRSTTNTG